MTPIEVALLVQAWLWVLIMLLGVIFLAALVSAVAALLRAKALAVNAATLRNSSSSVMQGAKEL